MSTEVWIWVVCLVFLIFGFSAIIYQLYCGMCSEVGVLSMIGLALLYILVGSALVRLLMGCL